jgi:putative ABC transport system permease protein
VVTVHTSHRPQHAAPAPGAHAAAGRRHRRPDEGNPRPILRAKLRRDMRATRWQVVAVVVTVALGVMLFAASYDAFRNLTASYQQTYDDLSFADLTVTGGDQATFASAAGATPGVAVVHQRVQADVPTQVPRDDGPAHTMVGRLVGMPAAEQPPVNAVDVLTGEYLDPDDPTGVLVEKHMSDHFGLTPGDTLTVALADGPTEVTVRGTVASPEYIWTAADRQSLFSLPDEFGVMFVEQSLARQAPPAAGLAQTLVRYDTEASATSLDATLATAALDAGAADIVRQEDQASNAALSEDLAGFGELSFMFPALFLSGAGFATFIILNRLVASQRGQIGVLMASGMTRRQVLRHYLGYGVVLGLSGAAVGLLLGVGVGAVITSTYTRLLSIPDTVVNLYWTTPIIGLVFGLAMGVLSAWAPARGAVRIPPAQAMRGDVGSQGGGRASLPERILPALSRLPVRYRIGLRGIGRHRARSSATVGGVALAIILVLVSWGMIDTVDRLMAKQFDVVSREDAQVYGLAPLDEPTLAAIVQTDGVAAAEPVVTLDVTLVTADDQYATRLQGFVEDTTMHGFVAADSAQLDLPPQGVLVGQSTQQVLGLAPDDSVTLRVPSLGVEVDTVVVGFVDEPLGTYAYGDQRWLTDALAAAGADQGALDSPAVTSAFVRYSDDADAEATLRALQQQPDVAAAVSATALRDLFEEYFTFFYVFIGVMLVLGGILAFALIFNMITATLAERAPELATMRASGVSASQVNRMMTVENLLLTLIGIPLGLLLGYLVAVGFMSSFSSDLFSFDLDMNPWTLLWTSLAVLVVAWLSQLPGLRAVRRLDIATVVRQRSL